MGQIDSFKKVLGITDQLTSSPQRAIVEDEVKEEKPKAARPRKKPVQPRKLTATLAVSADTRSKIRDLMYWARAEGLIEEATSENVLLLMLDCTLEKYPKTKKVKSQK